MKQRSLVRHFLFHCFPATLSWIFSDFSLNSSIFIFLASSSRIFSSSPVWPDLAKFCHFGKSLQVFGKFLTVYFLFGKMLSILWQIWDIIGIIFIAANGQILKNNLTIWSHLSKNKNPKTSWDWTCKQNVNQKFNLKLSTIIKRIIIVASVKGEIYIF